MLKPVIPVNMDRSIFMLCGNSFIFYEMENIYLKSLKLDQAMFFISN